MKYINQQGFMIEVGNPYDLYLKFAPEGGGFQKFMSKQEFDANFKPWDGVSHWRLTEVCIDGAKAFPAYLSGRLWNGWEMPRFTKEVGLQLVAHLAGDGCLQWQQELAAFTYESDGEVETFESEEIQVDGETLTVYGIGAGSWCWDEA